MEKNTFATSAFIGVNAAKSYEYLSDLRTLGEWTLGSRMKEQVDENTWLGTASGYQQPLYYHLRKLEGLPFPAIEWQCGVEYRQYYHVYPVLLFPSEYVEPGQVENGVYFHWISFVGPKRRTPLIMEGIDIVHTSECRALKARLERAAGLRAPAVGRYRVKASPIYVDAPFETLNEYLADLSNMNDWGHLLRLHERRSPTQAAYRDEYDRPIEVQVARYGLEGLSLLEYTSSYQDTGTQARTVAFVVPAAHAFGEPAAQGCILHRVTFVPQHTDAYPVEDIAAENLNIKRITEAKAGRLHSLARGLSYLGAEDVAP